MLRAFIHLLLSFTILAVHGEIVLKNAGKIASTTSTSDPFLRIPKPYTLKNCRLVLVYIPGDARVDVKKGDMCDIRPEWLRVANAGDGMEKCTIAMVNWQDSTRRLCFSHAQVMEGVRDALNVTLPNSTDTTRKSLPPLKAVVSLLPKFSTEGPFGEDARSGEPIPNNGVVAVSIAARQVARVWDAVAPKEWRTTFEDDDFVLQSGGGTAANSVIEGKWSVDLSQEPGPWNLLFTHIGFKVATYVLAALNAVLLLYGGIRLFRAHRSRKLKVKSWWFLIISGGMLSISLLIPTILLPVNSVGFAYLYAIANGITLMSAFGVFARWMVLLEDSGVEKSTRVGIIVMLINIFIVLFWTFSKANLDFLPIGSEKERFSYIGGALLLPAQLSTVFLAVWYIMRYYLRRKNVDMSPKIQRRHRKIIGLLEIAFVARVAMVIIVVAVAKYRDDARVIMALLLIGYGLQMIRAWSIVVMSPLDATCDEGVPQKAVMEGW